MDFFGCLFDPVFMVLPCFMSCLVGLGRTAVTAQGPKEQLSCIYIFSLSVLISGAHSLDEVAVWNLDRVS